MKKLVSFIIAAAAVASMSVTALASVDYNVADKSVTSDKAEGKRTVIITKGTGTSDSDIVYIGEAKNTYSALDKFLLKLDNGELADGEYTMRFNESEPVKFYVGMSNGTTDIQLTLIDGEGGSMSNSDGTKNIGYINEEATGTFDSIIIKKGDRYYGMKMSTTFTGTGTAVAVQINGVPENDSIQGVWLTSRDFTTN